MKRITAISICMMLLFGSISVCLGASNVTEEILEPAPGAAPLSPSPGPQLGVQTYYTDRTTFDADTGPLPFFEDFEEGDPGATGDFGGTLDQYTDNGYFKPDDIEPGIRFQDNPGPDNDGLGPVYMPPFISISVCTNFFVDSMDITFFNNDTWAVGMDLQSYLNPTTFDITIYGVGGVILDTKTAPANNVGIFWGVISDELITRINLYSPTETDGADNIAFGEPSATVDHIDVVPNPSTVMVGGTQQFTAIAFDEFNVPSPGVNVAWDTDVGSIDAAGLFTAQSTPAIGFVTATNGTVTGTSDVTVALGSVHYHHWRLDETSGSTAYDSVGGDHGAVTGCTMNQTGKVGKSYWFDGSNDYIQVPDNDTLDFSSGNDFCILAWINTTALNTRFMSKRQVPGDAKGYMMQLQNGRFSVYLDFGATGAYIQDTVSIADGLWHRVGMMRTGNTLEAFVDGGSIGVDNNAGGDISNDNPLMIGVEQDLTFDFTGYLDDIIISDDFPPTADAGPDQAVTQHTLVTFDGTGSSDDIGITNYWWNFTDGVPVTLTGASPSHTFDSEGTYLVTLTVMDTLGQTDSDTMFVSISDGDPPVADAGPDQFDIPGATIDFDGSDSFDPGHIGWPIDDGIVNWTWDLVDGVPVQFFGPTPSHTFADPGVYTVTLTVRDQVGLTGIDVMDVSILQFFDINITQAASSSDWILISFPNKMEGDPLTIVQDLDGDTTWDIAQWYDPTSPTGTQWKTTATFKPPSLNDFTYVNNTLGFWLHITTYGDGIIRMVGDIAESGEQAVYYIKPGWNLFGYPFPVEQMAMFTFGTSFVIDYALTYDQTDPYRLKFFDWFIGNHRPGRGYFVHATGYEVLYVTCP
jgi:PKD repeat protein